MEEDGVGRALCVVPQDDTDNLTLNSWEEAASRVLIGGQSNLSRSITAGKFPAACSVLQ